MINLTDNAVKILGMINEGFSLSQISYLLNISYEEIFNSLTLLHFNGFNISKKYYANGDMVFSLIKHSKFTNKNKNAIITEPNENDFEILVISDFHLGSLYERIDLINEFYYNYCKENNIHIVLNIGDILEGVINLSNVKIPWDEQVFHALDILPHVPDIITFLVLGNHDHSILMKYGQNIRDVLKNNFHDIVPLGYGKAEVKIKNDEIIMQHPLLIKEFKENNMYDHKLILRGHGHEAKVKMNGTNFILNVPSLSDLNFNKSSLPGAIKMHLKMLYGYIHQVKIDELIVINNKIHTVNEINLYTGNGKKYYKIMKF